MLSKVAAGARGAECKVFYDNFVAAREEHGAFDDVLKLAHISRPIMLEKCSHRRWREGSARIPVARIQAISEVYSEEWNVFSSLA